MIAATHEAPDRSVQDDETVGQKTGSVSVDEFLGSTFHVSGEASGSRDPVDVREPERTFVTHLWEGDVPTVEWGGGFALKLIHCKQEAGTAAARAVRRCAR